MHFWRFLAMTTIVVLSQTESDRILYHMPPGFLLVNSSKLVSSVDRCPSLTCPVMTSGSFKFLAIISTALDRVSSFEPQPVNTKQKQMESNAEQRFIVLSPFGVREVLRSEEH